MAGERHECSSRRRRGTPGGEPRSARERAPAGGRLVPLGAVPERAPVGHRARGLQRRRDSLGVPAPRSRPLTGLPLGRGRACRLLGRRAAPLPGARSLERARPDPEGANLRAHRQPGEPRRGRQGVLVVPRRDSERTPGTGGATTTRKARSLRGARRRRTRRAASRIRSSSCSTRESSTTTATGSSRPTTQRPGRTTCSSPFASRTRALRRTRSTSCRRPGTATPGPGTSTARSRSSEPTARVVTTEHPFLGALELTPTPGRTEAHPTLLFCDNETNDERIFGTASPAYPKDGINDHVVSGAASVNPDSHGTKAAYWYRLEVAAGRPSSCGCGYGREAAEARRGRTSTTWSRSVSGRPTSSTPS